jgi:cytochrome P450
MSAGNRMPGEPAPRYGEFISRIESYLHDSQPDSLAALISQTPAPDVQPAGQVVHWLFAMGDTLAANVFRTLAVLSTHDEQLFGRMATRDVEFPNGAVLPEGRQVLIYNVFNHRNRNRIPYADRFSPGEWVSGDAGNDWSYNFFSHGPQVCPGAGLAVFLGQVIRYRRRRPWTVRPETRNRCRREALVYCAQSLASRDPPGTPPRRCARRRRSNRPS